LLGGLRERDDVRAGFVHASVVFIKREVFGFVEIPAGTNDPLDVVKKRSSCCHWRSVLADITG
jgi:hypothetical protein